MISWSNLKNLPVQKHPQVVLMDLEMPIMDGIQTISIATAAYPDIKFIVLTVFEDDEKIFEAIKAGASGYLLKKSSPEEIVEAVKSLYMGGAPMSAIIARKVIESFQHPSSANKNDYELTTRETEILNSLIDGLSYKKLAEKYFISISTVRTHIGHIYEKLHVNSKAQAVAKALKK